MSSAASLPNSACKAYPLPSRETAKVVYLPLPKHPARTSIVTRKSSLNKGMRRKFARPKKYRHT